MRRRRPARRGWGRPGNRRPTDAWSRVISRWPQSVPENKTNPVVPRDTPRIQGRDARMNWLKALPTSNGKVGIIGTCSGGRHSYLTACRVKGFDAVVNCWGGGVVAAADQLNDKRPVAPVDLTKDLSCPVLGLFGND